jgi:AraC-like DNA-binding protein
MVKERIFTSASLLLLATPYCHARGYTLDDANHIIVILIVFVLALIGCGAYSLYYNRKISQRNEQLRRILTALDEYRAMVADDVFSLDDQEAYLQHQLEKPKSAKVEKRDAKQNFFVMMDARVTKEKPFTDPDFDHEALVKFMGVSDEAFCQLVPRYSDPERTLDYINSLRAEYAAKILMDHSDYSMDDMPGKCGFNDSAAFNSAFKFAFGITPTDYMHSMSQMFKKKGAPN